MTLPDVRIFVRCGVACGAAAPLAVRKRGAERPRVGVAQRTCFCFHQLLSIMLGSKAARHAVLVARAAFVFKMAPVWCDVSIDYGSSNIPKEKLQLGPFHDAEDKHKTPAECFKCGSACVVGNLASN